MDTYRITTDEGKHIVSMIQKIVDGKDFVDDFLPKFETMMESFETRLEEDAFAFYGDAVTVLDLYEPNKKIYEAEKDQGILNSEEAIRDLKILLDRVKMG